MDKTQQRAIGYAVILIIISFTTSFVQAQQSVSHEKIYAQQLVDETVARYPAVKNVELAVDSDTGCATIAATDPKDIGEQCDADEIGPVRTGQPNVAEPTRDDITQALHDASGTLIGAVGMDLAPQPGQDRTAMVTRAREILQDLESRIPSKSKLYEPVSSR